MRESALSNSFYQLVMFLICVSDHTWCLVAPLASTSCQKSCCSTGRHGKAQVLTFGWSAGRPSCRWNGHRSSGLHTSTWEVFMCNRLKSGFGAFFGIWRIFLDFRRSRRRNRDLRVLTVSAHERSRRVKNQDFKHLWNPDCTWRRPWSIKHFCWYSRDAFKGTVSS